MVIEELYKDNIKQNICETATQIDGVYYGANWKGSKENNEFLSKVASYMIPHAVLKESNSFDIVYDGSNTETEYIENELYPLGVSFLIDGRYKTNVFPLCGWNEGQTIDYQGYSYHRIPYITKVIPEINVRFKVKSVNGAHNAIFLDTNANLMDLLAGDGSILKVNNKDVSHLSMPFYTSLAYISFSKPNYEAIVALLVDPTSGNDSITLKCYNYTITGFKNLIDGGINIQQKIEIIESIDNKLGLYSFPEKSIIAESTQIEAHFKHLGLQVDYEYAKAFISSYMADKPNITAFYIVQGKRQKNFLCQGYSVASVEAVGFEHLYTTMGGATTGTTRIGQNTKLGSNDYDAAFPFIDGSNKRLFPVLRVNRSYKYNDFYSVFNIDDYSKRVWRLDVNSPSQLWVRNKVEQLLPIPYKHNYDHGYFQDKAKATDLISDYEASEMENYRTNKFCIFSPDILLDRSLVVKSDIYVKPVISLHDVTERVSDPFGEVVDDDKQYNTFTAHNNRTGNGLSYYDDYPRILNPDMLDYKKPSMSNEQRKMNSMIINENTIMSDFNGFSTRMKSILEVYGKDISSFDSPQQASVTAFLNNTRYKNMSAGILINRSKKDVSDENSTEPIFRTEGLFGSDGYRHQWGEYPFGCQMAVPFNEENDDNSIPVIASNMSMKSLPYIGVVCDSLKLYGKNADIDDPDNDYRGLHNCIVNINSYASFEEYLSSILNTYNVLTEEYSIIADDKFVDAEKEDDDISLNIYKGDLFSQKTFMRCIKWTDLPGAYNFKIKNDLDEPSYNKSYGWKYGSSIYLYLQSTVNTYLRVASADETFYPYILESNLGTTQETMDLFTWKSEKENVLRESWKYNDGYHQLLGIYKLPAYDKLFDKQSFLSPNRIRYSLKHVSGAFVDQYREILLDNFNDFAFENGEIMKLVKYNNTLFSIQSSAILQHYGSQRMEATGDTSEIILGDKTVLSDNYRQIGELGTQHKESVVVGDNGIYGIDWKRETIWRIKPSATATGGLFFSVEDLGLSKNLTNLFTELKNQYNKVLKQDLYGTPVQGIIGVYDEKNHNIMFTFQCNYVVSGQTQVLSKTIVFNELFDFFISEYSSSPSFWIKHDKGIFSYEKGTSKILSNFTASNYASPFEMEFVVNCRTEGENNAGEFEKEFKAHLINMCPQEIDYIKWTTKYQESTKSPFVYAPEFWSNPEYREHNWCVPIKPNTKQNTGPLGTINFKTFEPGSQMKGQWIKVKLYYSGNNHIELRDVITNFIISY